MSNSSYAPSNETHCSPRHSPSVPSSPEPPTSLTLTEVLLPPTAPTFPLTLISNITQDYLLVSPSSAETILALNPMLNATICATAFRLTNTIRQRTEHYSQRLTEVGLHIMQLKWLNEQHNTNNRQL